MKRYIKHTQIFCNADSELNDLLSPGKHNLDVPGDNLRYSIKTEQDNPYIWVHGIVVDKDQRNLGIGTDLLSKVIHLSDISGYPIELFAVPIRDSEMTDEELIDWYINRGFQYAGGIGNHLMYYPK